MPVINGVKYACEPCMRGHRSSKCTHDDRLLVRVRKPGRPLSSCPHLPSGADGTTTFVDANGVRLDGLPSHGSRKPCGCQVTSLAIPKVAACACSASPPPMFTQMNLKIQSQQAFDPMQNTTIPSSPGSPGLLYTANDSASGRITKPGRKRKGIPINGEAILDLTVKQPSINSTKTDRLQSFTGPEFDNCTTGISSIPGAKLPSQVQHQRSKCETQNSSNPHLHADDGPHWTESSWHHGTGNHSTHRLFPDDKGSANFQPIAQPQKPCCGGPKPATTLPSFPHPSAQQLLMGQSSILPFQQNIYHTPNTQQFPTFPGSIQHMQPIATTIYTYPNGYTTINNPLTPEEIAMFQAAYSNAQTHGSTWSGFSGVTMNQSMEHVCLCGPGCTCLGCAAHPYNASTLNFVRDMHDMMVEQSSNKRHKTMQSHPVPLNAEAPKSGGCCGSRDQQRPNNTISTAQSCCKPVAAPLPEYPAMDIGHKQGQEEEYSPQTNQNLSNHHSPTVHTARPPDSPLSNQSGFSPLHNDSAKPPVRPHHCRPAFPPHASSPAYTSSSSPDVCGGDEETEQRVVSPSAFFHIDYPLGFCSENDMACMCGDDCTCVGCIIHGNNIPDVSSAFHPTGGSEPSNQGGGSGEKGKDTLAGCCGERPNNSITNDLDHIENFIRDAV